MKNSATKLLFVSSLLFSCSNNSTISKVSSSSSIENPKSSYPFTDEEYLSMNDDDYISNFIPEFRLALASDLHIHDSDTEKSSYYKRVVKLCTLSNQVSETSPNYKNLDAVLIAGDMVDNGKVSQYQKVKSIFDANLKTETKLITTTGNHDYWNDKQNTIKNYLSVFNDQKEDQVIKINGINIISICPSDPSETAKFNETKIAWLDRELRKASKNTPNMPIFVMSHYASFNTVYGSYQTHFGTSDLEESLSLYPQVVYISGHSHFPIADPRSLSQGNYTAINTGTTSYSCHRINGVNQYDMNVYPSNRYGAYVTKCPWVGDPFEIGDLQIVEVNKFGSLLIHGYDLLTESKIFTRLVRYTSDKNKFVTNEMKREVSVSPEFSESSFIRIQELTSTSIYVHIPASVSEEYIESYRAVLYNENDEIIDTQYCLGDQFLQPHSNDFFFTFSNLSSTTSYKLKVYAVNAYEKLSNRPLELTFKTLD